MRSKPPTGLQVALAVGPWCGSIRSEKAAVSAVRKWKYNPKVESGEAVERPGIDVRLEFALKR